MKIKFFDVFSVSINKSSEFKALGLTYFKPLNLFSIEFVLFCINFRIYANSTNG